MERVARLSPETFYRDYVRRNRPVIITDMAAGWPACKLWRPDYFLRFPDVKVEVMVQEQKKEAGQYFRTRRFALTDFPGFMELMNQGGTARHYLNQWDVFKALPQLRDDVPLDGAYTLSAGLSHALGRVSPSPPTRLLWMGPGGTFTPLHFDSPDNLYVQVHGRKRVVLFSPDQGHLLYFPWYEMNMPNFSPIDLEHPDLGRFPRFARARPEHVLLEPGEILYIPTRWWHQVTSLEPSISLSHWWNSQLVHWEALLTDARILASRWFRTTVLRRQSFSREHRPVEEVAPSPPPGERGTTSRPPD